MELEICIQSIEELNFCVLNEVKHIEICQALDMGGLTPSYAFIESAVLSGIQTNVLIRPRAGNFHYSQSEWEMIVKDIKKAIEIGASGIVFGCLDEWSCLDKARMKEIRILTQEQGVEFCCHRAIDVSNNLDDNIRILNEISVDRVLTSGQSPRAIDGIEILKKMRNKLRQNIKMLVGSGIRADHIPDFKRIGMDGVHISIGIRNGLNNDFGFGNDSQIDIHRFHSVRDAIAIR
ncbi:MAG TPA: copper homeostasis protein CutC [Saprospiraceae bacterium]|mgnify:CR=1 FL=1|nr:copper homeostasis protein CutC [Saprospiraceae bacterium]